MQLRPYQQQALDSTYQQWNGGTRSTLLVLATGLGKSVCASHITAHGAAAGRTLFLAHRKELLLQMRMHYRKVGLDAEIEMADERVDVSSFPDVVLGSVPTMRSEKRLRRFPRNYFARVIVDEAHHAAAQSYATIIDYFDQAMVLGLTATPDRADKVGLDEVFGDVAMRYDIGDGIHDGWLVPLVARTIVVEELDLSQVRVVAGDLNARQLEEQVAQEGTLHQIADPLVRESHGRATVVYTPGVESANELARVLAGYVGADAVASISGETPPERRLEILNAYARGEIRFLTNCMILTEGWDAPHTSCVAMCRPTKSRALKAQMIGRGTRPLRRITEALGRAADRDERKRIIAQSTKPNCLLLDFTGTGRIDLAGPTDVLGGEELRLDAKQYVLDALVDKDPRQLEEILEAAEAFADKQEEERTLKRRQAKVRVQTKYVTDPIELVGLGDRRIDAMSKVIAAAKGARKKDCGRCKGSGVSKSGRTCGVCKGKMRVVGVAPWDKRVPNAHRAFLAQYGVKLPPTAHKRQSGVAMDVVKRMDLCTLKQAHRLKSFGLRTDLTKTEASRAIGAVYENGGRVSSEIARRWGRLGTASTGGRRAPRTAASAARPAASAAPPPTAPARPATPPPTPRASGGAATAPSPAPSGQQLSLLTEARRRPK